MMSSPGNLRPQGVRTANTEYIAPKTLTHIEPVQMYAAQYGDLDGVAHSVLLMRVGSTWYCDQNSESWMQKLVKVPDWFMKQIESRGLTGTPVPKAEGIPSRDGVDILPKTEKR